MDDFDQVAFDDADFGTAEFAENPEPRCPCLLLLDTSASMSGEPIRLLNEGVMAFKEELTSDDLASKRAEVAVVTFGPPKVEVDFETADFFVPPTLDANGATPMGAAIEKAIEMVSARKQSYRSGGVAYYRPWIFMITDGAPTDDWSRAAARVYQGEEASEFSFFAVGVQGANMETLAAISSRAPLKLDGLRFRDMFKWLSTSMKAVSHSQTGDSVPLSNPATPEGWASV